MIYGLIHLQKLSTKLQRLAKSEKSEMINDVIIPGAAHADNLPFLTIQFL